MQMETTNTCYIYHNHKFHMSPFKCRVISRDLVVYLFFGMFLHNVAHIYSSFDLLCQHCNCRQPSQHKSAKMSAGTVLASLGDGQTGNWRVDNKVDFRNND